MMLKNKLKHTSHTISEEDIKELALLTDGYSGYDIDQIVKKAKLDSLSRIQNANRFK